MRERVSWGFAQTVFWAGLGLGVTVLGVSSRWAGLALIAIGIAVPIWKGWPNIWRRLQGEPLQPGTDVVPGSGGTLFTDLREDRHNPEPFPGQRLS